MILPLNELARLSNHALAFDEAAKACGFSSPGDINRFVSSSYGKALREIPQANRPKGAIFFLEPPATAGAIASTANIKTILFQIRTNVARKFFLIPLDYSGGVPAEYETNSAQRNEMIAGAWPLRFAQLVSRHTQRCVVWANGISVFVFLAGDCYQECHDVVEDLSSGIPLGFDSLSWDDGAIVNEFAQHELNDTSQCGVWLIPEHWLLRPKPERMMTSALGRFLRYRMAGYHHYEEEGHVENEGRADISLTHCNGCVYIVEVKWIGRSLKSTKVAETEKTIIAELKKKATNWVTEFDDTTIESGARQLARYFNTGKYHRGYLAIFDCRPPTGGRKSEDLPVDPTHVAPHKPDDFRILRACVDPRKASIASKAKQP